MFVIEGHSISDAEPPPIEPKPDTKKGTQP